MKAIYMAGACALALGLAAPAPAQTAASDSKVETVVVTGQHYKADDASSATKTDTPILVTPVSIEVITSQVLADQQTLHLVDALQNVAGVVASNDCYGTCDSFSIRGFDSEELTYEDGLKLDQYSISGFPLDPADIQSIEVVKGPASVLYGQAEPGGLVSVVTKKPTEAPYFEIGQQFGSFDLTRMTADLSGPIDQGTDFLYRLNLDYQNSGSFRDFVHNHRFSAFPTFEWRIDPQDDLLLELKYGEGSNVLDNGLPFLANGSVANLPIKSNFANPGSNVSEITEYAAKLSYSRDFGDGWKLRAVYRAEYVDDPTPVDIVYSGDADASGNLSLFGFTSDVFKHWTQQGIIDLTGKFDTFGVQHTLIAGVDYYHMGGGYVANFVFPPSIDIYAPIFNRPYAPPSPAGNFAVSQIENAYGVYLQDQMKLPWGIYVLAGFRYDDETLGDTGYGNPAQRVTDTPPPTPRVGVLWQPVDTASLYASYTSNYGDTALGALTVNGALLPPESAQQYEVGGKAEFLDRKLSVTASVYQLTKQNIPAADPTNPLFTIAIGAARSRGFELDATGTLAPRWQIIAGYSAIDSVTTQDTNMPSLQGLEFPGIPRQSGSLWSTYEVPSGLLKGLTFGGGIVARSGEVAWESPTGLSYQADRIGGFAIVNAMAGYDFTVDGHTLHAQINGNNILNKVYFASVNPGQAMPGAPAGVLFQIGARY